MTAFGQLNYSDARYGVSFQYPDGYKLTPGALGNDDEGLGMPGPIPMEFDTPGERLVTVETPHDAYPGTDLVNAFFTVSVNPYLTRDECGHLPDEISDPDKHLLKRISGIEFRGHEESEAAMMHQYSAVYYHGFSKGYCYELGYGLATAGFGAEDDLKQVDSEKVYSILEKILRTVKVRPPARTSATNSPSIQMLTIAPLQNQYRISWDVAGARDDQVWVSVICSDEVKALRAAGARAAPRESEFPCDVPGPARSVKGTLDLEFKNLSGETADETARLFVEGQRSISKTLTFSLPPPPAVWGIESLDGHQYLNHGKQKSPLLIDVGQSIKIEGSGFDGHETVRIGSTSIPIGSFDRGHSSLILKVPTSLPTGEAVLLVKNDKGTSNPVLVQLERTQPRIFEDSGSPRTSTSRIGTIAPGQLVHMFAEGYLTENTVWIGSTSTTGRISGGRMTVLCSSDPRSLFRPCLDFTAPASLAPGTYPIYFTNELGKSNILTITVSEAR